MSNPTPSDVLNGLLKQDITDTNCESMETQLLYVIANPYVPGFLDVQNETREKLLQVDAFIYTVRVFDVVSELFCRLTSVNPVFKNFILTNDSQNSLGGASCEEVVAVMMGVGDELGLTFTPQGPDGFAGFNTIEGGTVSVVFNDGHFSVMLFPRDCSPTFVPVVGDGYCAVWAVMTAAMIASEPQGSPRWGELMLGSEKFYLPDIVGLEVSGHTFPMCPNPRDLDTQAAFINSMDGSIHPCRGYRRTTTAVGESAVGGGGAPAASAGGGAPDTTNDAAIAAALSNQAQISALQEFADAKMAVELDQQLNGN